MTKGGPFDAALSLLEGAAFAIRGHAKNREKALRNCREISNACLVLRAAGKINRERAGWCLQWSDTDRPDTLESQHGITRRQYKREMEKLTGLIAALPVSTEDSDD